jgi:hypothetical protein
MRYYLLGFHPAEADMVIGRANKRLQALHEATRMSGEVETVSVKIDSSTGQRFAMYISEQIARSYPQFVEEFSGEWLS